MWDRDITTANELISETRIKLNSHDFYRLLDK